MQCNVGGADSFIRIAIGIVILYLVFLGPATPWGFLGLLPLITGLTGICPLLFADRHFHGAQSARQKRLNRAAPTASTCAWLASLEQLCLPIKHGDALQADRSIEWRFHPGPVGGSSGRTFEMLETHPDRSSDSRIIPDLGDFQRERNELVLHGASHPLSRKTIQSAEP